MVANSSRYKMLGISGPMHSFLPHRSTRCGPARRSKELYETSIAYPTHLYSTLTQTAPSSRAKSRQLTSSSVRSPMHQAPSWYMTIRGLPLPLPLPLPPSPPPSLSPAPTGRYTRTVISVPSRTGTRRSSSETSSGIAPGTYRRWCFSRSVVARCSLNARISFLP